MKAADKNAHQSHYSMSVSLMVFRVDRKEQLCQNCIFYFLSSEHAVALLVKALRYKPEGRRFYSRCH
jgi:hypothetical protein